MRRRALTAGHTRGVPRGPGGVVLASTIAVAVAVAVATAAGVSGCGSGSSGSPVNVPAVAPARVFGLAAFQPDSAVPARRPVTVSFTVRKPDGGALTRYRTGSGPHTGIHLIIVRDDLRYLIHRHPPIAADGRLTDTVTFPAPGPYRVLVDLYPNIPGGQPNFQLVHNVTVAGAYRPRPLPPFTATQTAAGYRVTMQGKPALHAVQASLVNITVTDAHGRPAVFRPWFGALAHAIFFHRGSLDYFHTHVCGPGATNCTSAIGAARVAGTSTTPGKLTLGVLLPVPGAWELFLQAQLGRRVITVPYTLDVT